MTKVWLLILTGLVTQSFASAALGDEPTLSGFWKTPSGTIYRYVQTDQTVVATYDAPSPDQIGAGIKKGDLALKGTYIGNVLFGTFYQRAPLAIQALCPEHQIIDQPFVWELNDNVLVGTLTLVFGTDESCQITRRALKRTSLERADDLPFDKIKQPLDTPATWQSSN